MTDKLTDGDGEGVEQPTGSPHDEAETIWEDAALAAEAEISEELVLWEDRDELPAALVPDPKDTDQSEGEVIEPEDVEAVEAPTKAAIREEVLADVKEHFETADLDESFAPAPTEEFIDEQWFDFDYLDGYVEIERRWVNEPYAYISVLFDDDVKEFRYHVSEPTLDRFEEYVRQDLTRILRNSLMHRDLEEDRDRADLFDAEAKAIIGAHAATVEGGTLYKLLYYLTRDFVEYGKIDPLMRDPAIEDISCDGVDIPVFVYHREFRDLQTNVQFSKSALDSFTVRLAQRAGKNISVSDPLVDASLPDGSRIQLTLGGEISTRGSNFTIRKFSAVPITPVQLIDWHTFSVDQMAYFWLAIENNKSLVFSGGTGSGKTTSMNAVSFFIPPNSKVVSIEDTREITLPHDNWIQSVTRSAITEGGRGEVNMYQLLQSALRQRPEYLLVGEIRTEAKVALTFFQAIGTGHTAYTTIHADSIEGVLSRLQNEPLSVPAQMIKNLDVVSIQRQIRQEETRVRRTQDVVEILPGGGGDEVLTRPVFQRNPREDTHEWVNDSHVFEEIQEDRGWDDDELRAAYEVRKEVLQYLLDNDVTAYADVTALLHTFSKDAEYVLEKIRSGDLGPEDVEASMPTPPEESALAGATPPAGGAEERDDTAEETDDTDEVADAAADNAADDPDHEASDAGASDEEPTDDLWETPDEAPVSGEPPGDAGAESEAGETTTTDPGEMD